MKTCQRTIADGGHTNHLFSSRATSQGSSKSCRHTVTWSGGWRTKTMACHGKPWHIARNIMTTWSKCEGKQNLWKSINESEACRKRRTTKNNMNNQVSNHREWEHYRIVSRHVLLKILKACLDKQPMEEKSVGARKRRGPAKRRNSAARTVPFPESDTKTAFPGTTAFWSAAYSPNGEPGTKKGRKESI